MASPASSYASRRLRSTSLTAGHSRSRSTSELPVTPCWYGDCYAVEIMQRLGLPEGAVRVGIVHYNTADEVRGLLAQLAELAAK